MDNTDLDPLRELSWRPRLTPAEAAELEKRLAARPQDRKEWQTETALTQLLERAPGAPPVSSNFTALVLQAVERDAATQARGRKIGWLGAWRGWNWVPRIGVAGLMVGFALVGYQQHQVHARESLAQNMVTVAEAVSASGPDFVRDLEPIRRLSDTQPHADAELISLMTSK